MLLIEEQPHVELHSRTGGVYRLPIDAARDAYDFFMSRDPYEILETVDAYGSALAVERSDVVAVLVLEAETLARYAAERDERRRRALLGAHD